MSEDRAPGAPARSSLPDRQRSTGPLSGRQHRRKEDLLTQPASARVPESGNALVLKQGSLFLLATDSGDVPWDLPHGFGLFYEDCRFLDGYTLTMNGAELTVLSSAAGRAFETHHDLANPALTAPDGGPPIAKETIAVRRKRLIHGGVLHELLTIRNYGSAAAGLRLELRFRSRFEDVFILRGFVAGPRGTAHLPRVSDGGTLDLGYDGRDGRQRSTSIAFSPAPGRLEAGRATFEWTLEPGAARELALSITPSSRRAASPARCAVPPSARPDPLKRRLEQSDGLWLAGSVELRASNPLFGRVLRRALLDLRLLRSRLGGQHYFAAGIPWFATLFGRDAAITAIQTLPYGAAVARETLQLLARYQARTTDAYRDAEPGKILHELRTGELARLRAIPHSPAYYGTVDATMLFLILLAEYVNWSGDLGLVRTLRPNVEAALGWMERHADHDGDGYLDYVGAYGSGLINQGWKDSGNAIVNADGSLAKPPVALAEVQAYAYRAWRQTAGLLRALGDQGRAKEVERRADDLCARFERDFWSAGLGCYVLARQADGRPAAVVASNAGQVLWGGAVAPDRATRVAARLMAPDMFSGWGIRTLSSEAAAYNPMSYHRGSVWPHDNSLIIGGFCRYGQDGPALRVFDALFEAAGGFANYRVPELYCGFERRDGDEQPVRYPLACSPQAWAAGAIPYALRSLLGLHADALDHRLEIVRPRLPTWLDWLEVRGTRVGAARVDLRFERAAADGVAMVDWTVREGDLRVRRTEQLPPSDTFS